MVVVKINERLNDYYKTITIRDLAQGVFNNMTHTYNHFSLNEMLKELKLLTRETQHPTRLGRDFCYEYFSGSEGIRLEKPNDVLEYKRK